MRSHPNRKRWKRIHHYKSSPSSSQCTDWWNTILRNHSTHPRTCQRSSEYTHTFHPSRYGLTRRKHRLNPTCRKWPRSYPPNMMCRSNSPSRSWPYRFHHSRPKHQRNGLRRTVNRHTHHPSRLVRLRRTYTRRLRRHRLQPEFLIGSWFRHSSQGTSSMDTFHRNHQGLLHTVPRSSERTHIAHPNIAARNHRQCTLVLRCHTTQSKIPFDMWCHCSTLHTGLCGTLLRIRRAHRRIGCYSSERRRISQ